MDWGVFFEPVHKRVIEQLFGVDILETSLAQGNGFMRGCH